MSLKMYIVTCIIVWRFYEEETWTCLCFSPVLPRVSVLLIRSTQSEDQNFPISKSTKLSLDFHQQWQWQWWLCCKGKLVQQGRRWRDRTYHGVGAETNRYVASLLLGQDGIDVNVVDNVFAFMKHLFSWLYIQMMRIVESKRNIHRIYTHDT